MSEEKSEEKRGSCPEFSMEDWIKQPDPRKDDLENCRKCRLPVTTNWYFTELKEKGLSDLAASLEKLASKEDDPELALTICREFDRIKGVVEEPLRERLKDFDCATQSFNPDEQVVPEATTASSENS